MRTSRLLVAAALGLEAAAVRRGAPDVDVVVTGMGPAKAKAAVPRLRASLSSGQTNGKLAERELAERELAERELAERELGDDPTTDLRNLRPFVVAGCAGGLQPGLKAGDVIIAGEVRGPSSSVSLPGASLLAAVMCRAGLQAQVGVVVSTDHVVKGAERAELAASGALVVDMESAWLLEATSGNEMPRAVVRVVLDVPGRELPSVWTARDAWRCSRSLSRASTVLAAWADVTAPRQVILAGPRSFCAGVDRAIATVEQAIERFGAPIYVRKQIVHNAHVVADLASRGAVFVEELDEVPDGATTVFSAHGVSPAVRKDAEDRDLQVIDATCPLVAKVHAEARRFVRQGYSVVLVGHSGHDEIEGTMGEGDVAGGNTVQLVENVGGVDAIDVPDPDRVAYLTQTTLAHDETTEIIERLRERFPALVGPASTDICYATSNRQEALRTVARECDLVLVIGSENSSNSNRLVEVAEREGCSSRLIDDETDIRLDWLAHTQRVGVTAGASAPESLVQRVIDTLASLGPVEVSERTSTTESVQFSLPMEVR